MPHERFEVGTPQCLDGLCLLVGEIRERCEVTCVAFDGVRRHAPHVAEIADVGVDRDGAVYYAARVASRELGIGNWELGVGSWELGINFKSPVFDSLSSEE